MISIIARGLAEELQAAFWRSGGVGWTREWRVAVCPGAYLTILRPWFPRSVNLPSCIKTKVEPYVPLENFITMG
jgi:hypothetical protein